MPPKRVPSPIGQRIEMLRGLGELPARELDRLAETTEGHASLIESGVVKNVSAETVAKLAHVLGASLDWLIAGEGKAPSERTVRSSVEAARARSKSTGTEG